MIDPGDPTYDSSEASALQDELVRVFAENGYTASFGDYYNYVAPSYGDGQGRAVVFDGTYHNMSSGDITISESQAESGIEADAFINRGRAGILASGVGSIGIESAGPFSNLAGGSIQASGELGGKGITAAIFQNQGQVQATARGSGSVGIESAGAFNNLGGAVIARGMAEGKGITAGSFENQGEVQAAGSGSGSVGIESTGAFNSLWGKVIARGEAAGKGITADTFQGQGEVQAIGSGTGSVGIETTGAYNSLGGRVIARGEATGKGITADIFQGQGEVQTIGSGTGSVGIETTGAFTVRIALNANADAGGRGITASSFRNEGEVQATARGEDSVGIQSAGAFNSLGGAVISLGEGGGKGITADTFQSQGEVQAAATGTGSVGIETRGAFTVRIALKANADTGGTGIKASSFESQGEVQASASGVNSIGIESAGLFGSAGGSVIARGEAGGKGISTDAFQSQGPLETVGIGPGGLGTEVRGALLSAGAVKASGEAGGTGLLVAGGDLPPIAGLTASGAGTGSYGLIVDSGGHRQSGANPVLVVRGSDDGVGMYLSGDFSQAGTVRAEGNSGTGLLADGDYIMNSGLLELQGNGNALVVGGSFTQQAGTLRLVPSPAGEPGGPIAAVNTLGGQTVFGGRAELRPVVDLQSGLIGCFHSAASVSITQGATLEPELLNSFALAIGQETDKLVFLSAADGISGEFLPLKDSLTMGYDYTYQAEAAEHSISVFRTANPSAFADPGNRSALQGLEARRAWLRMNPDHLLARVASGLDSQSSRRGINKIGRGLTAWGSATAMHAAATYARQAQNDLSRQLRLASRSFGGEPGRANRSDPDSPAFESSDLVMPEARPQDMNTASGPKRHLFVAPLARYDRYRANDGASENLDGGAFGVSAGAVFSLEPGELGFGVHALHGRLDSSDFESNATTLGLSAAIRSQPLEMGPASPWFEAGASYAHSWLEQERTDALGGNHEASPRQQALHAALAIGQDLELGQNLRLSPQIGVDYTWVRQSSFSEDGNALRLGVDAKSLNSLRPKAGVELAYEVSNSFAVKARVYYHYETLDSKIALKTRVINTPLAFYSQSDRRDRSSGSAGLGLSWQVTPRLSILTDYDVVLEDRYQGHQVDLKAKLRF